MRRLFYAVAQRGFMLRALLVLGVVAAIAIAAAAPEIAVAAPDAFGP